MRLAIFLFVLLAACLLWTATFTAAAARARRFGWALLLAGLVVPLAVLLPLLAVTGWLAFGRHPIHHNMFLPVAVTAAAALGGGIWIVIAGRQPTGLAGARAAGRWKVVPLAAAAALAAIGTSGTVALFERLSAREAIAWYAEASAIVEATLPPPIPEGANAASLHRQAAVLFRDDPEYRRDGFFPWIDEIDAGSREAVRALAAHAEAIDVARRAADRDACRFDGDWSRWSVSSPMPEHRILGHEADLLALAARRAAIEGRPADALADVVRIRRLARQSRGCPGVIAGIQAAHLTVTFCETLTSVLQAMEPIDLPLLDGSTVADSLADVPSMVPTVLQEEAMVLATFADVAAGRLTLGAIDGGWRDIPRDDAFGASILGTLYRAFLLDSDRERCRSLARLALEIAAERDRGATPWPEIVRRLDTFYGDRVNRGILVDSLQSIWVLVLDVQTRAEASVRAARVGVAATRHRLRTGGLPQTLADLVPGDLSFLPRDPFTADETLRMKPVDRGMVVYYVGSDGKDDGGPTTRERSENDSDDFGLWLAPDDVGLPPRDDGAAPNGEAAPADR